MKVLKPKTIKELHDILSSNKLFAFIAGATDIIPSIKKGVEKRKNFIDLSSLKEELSGISETVNYVEIKAMTDFNQIQSSTIIKRYFPKLVDSAKTIGGFTIQNMATIAGNIANASPAADSLPMLLVLDSLLVLNGPNGKREIKLDKFYRAYKDIDLNNNEYIESIIIPKVEYVKEYFDEVGTRRAVSISKISLAYVEDINGNIRIASGSVAAYPKRLYNCEEYAKNKTSESFRDILKKDIAPIDDIRSSGKYRFQVVYNIVKSLIE